jgi:hypothetical protein
MRKKERVDIKREILPGNRSLWDTKQDKRLKFYKTMELPCLPYGSETCTLRTEEKRLQAERCNFYSMLQVLFYGTRKGAMK